METLIRLSRTPAPNGNGSKEIALNKPSNYDGDRHKLDNFLHQTRTYLQVNDRIYDSSLKKIAFVLSLCTSGTAQTFALNAYEKDWINQKTWDEFLTEFRSFFQGADPQGDAYQYWLTIRQIDRCDEYQNRFELARIKAGIPEDSPQAIHQYRNGLLPALHMRVAQHTPMPRTLREWYTVTLQLDNQFRQFVQYNRRLPQRRNPPSSLRPAYSPYPRSKPATSSDANQRNVRTIEAPPDLEELTLQVEAYEEQTLNRMTAEQRANHMKNNLCFRCHQKGHMALNCPIKPRTPPQRSTASRPPANRYVRAITAADLDSTATLVNADDSDSSSSKAPEDPEVFEPQRLAKIMHNLPDDQYDELIDLLDSSDFFGQEASELTIPSSSDA